MVDIIRVSEIGSAEENRRRLYIENRIAEDKREHNLLCERRKNTC